MAVEDLNVFSYSISITYMVDLWFAITLSPLEKKCGIEAIFTQKLPINFKNIHKEMASYRMRKH